MKTKTTLLLALAGTMLLTGFEAFAEGGGIQSQQTPGGRHLPNLASLANAARLRPTRRYRYRRPIPRRPVYHQPQTTQQRTNSVAPKTLVVSGTLYSLYAPARSLTIQDDNTRSTMTLVITPQTQFIRGGQQVQPTAFTTYEHVAVTYQDTDRTVKEVRLTPPSGAPAHANKPKAQQPRKF